MRFFVLIITLSFLPGLCFAQVGMPVSSFGIKGMVNTNMIDVNKGREIFNAVAIQPDGKIIAAGITMIPGVIFRYNTDGTLDKSFDFDGMLFCTGRKFSAVAVQADGKIVAAGSGFTVRVNSNGSFDGSFGTDGIAASVSSDPTMALQADGKILIASSTTISRLNVNGSPDASFDTDGQVTITFGPAGSKITSVAIQTDGKIVVTGQYTFGTGTAFALACCNNDGSPDNTFDGDGILTTDFGSGSAKAISVAFQNDGKIIAAGYSIYDNYVLARYNSDGSLDNSFDGDGKVITHIPNASASSSGRNYASVAIKSNGKILLAAPGNFDFALLRYNNNGSPDSSFDGDGVMYTDLESRNNLATCMAMSASDEKVVVGGFSYVSAAEDFALVRYNSDGSLDNSFDGDGKITYHFGTSWDLATSLAVQNDGKILVAGYTGLVESGSTNDMAIIRYNPDGSIDSSFDLDGKVIQDIGTGTADDKANSIAIQNDGKILVAGTSILDFSMARYNTDGSLDNSFDLDGKVTTNFISNSIDAATCMVIQPDGKIVLAGYSGRNLNWHIALARYNQDGSPDNGFNGNGKVISSSVSSSDRVSCMAIQTDGKIVVGGKSGGSTVVLRYNTDGSLDNSFDGDGVLSIVVTPRSLAIQPDGKIVMASDGSPGFVINRYNPDGSPDNSFDGDGVLANTEAGGFPISVTINNNGKIFVTGASGGGYFFQYNSDGSTDNSFDGDGKAFMSLSPVAVQSITAIKFHDNRIYMAGEIRNAGGSDFYLAAAFAKPPGSPSMLMIDFSGKLITDDALLSWNTKNEENMLEFIVERSIDGRNFTAVGHLNASNDAGTNHYGLTDFNVTALRSPVVYYRLKQKGLDGSFIYSRTIVLPIDKSIVLVYPNPVINEINIVFTTTSQQKVFAKIVDNKGRLMKQQQWNLAAGSASLSMNVEGLAKGIYYLKIKGDNVEYTKQFLK